MGHIMIPNINFILKKIIHDVSAIIITHAHEDHIGSIPYLWPEINCPLFATPFTSCVINEKLKEHGLNNIKKITIIKSNSILKVEQFQVEFIPITHSIPEMHALVISTDKGQVFHTGD